MSDEKKLSDDLEDMIGSAKEGAKKAADKAGEFAEEAKEKAKEFADDAKEILSDGKNVAIISHLWVVGWIIAIVMNNNNKTELGSFYIRQNLGIYLIGLLGFIPLISWIVGVTCFVLWLMSLVGALGGSTKPVMLLGEQFQKWFKSF